MNILIIDPEELGLDFAMKCEDAGHEVKLWQPTTAGTPCPVGVGIVDKPKEWKPLMNWADLILPTTNSKYAAELEPYFEKGYPILGANRAGAELELNREVGQQVLMDLGIDCLPAKVFSDYDEAIKYVKDTKKAYASKPWGGNMDKSMTYVSKSPADMVFKLEQWKALGKLKGEFMLQEKINGIEMGVSGWFGPGGWTQWIEEDFEEKKMLNDNLGVNTGEQGTILRFTKSSRLFDKVLKPMIGYLHEINYVGNINVNCMIDDKGKPWPLEFTCRFGWPAFPIHTTLLSGDPAKWMVDLINGKDTMEVSQDIVVGVVISHGDYPWSKLPAEETCGFPLYGLKPSNKDNVHFQHVMAGRAPMMVGGQVEEVDTYVTAGDYICIVTGTGKTVTEATKAAYEVAWKLDLPSNKQMRTDIGKRLKKQLPLLHSYGFAKGLEW